MANGFYNSPVDIAPVTRARSTDINTIDQAIDTAFDKLPTEERLKQGRVTYTVDAGVAANAYVVALPYAPASYLDGLEVTMRPTRTNTGACTINVNGLGVKAIKRTDGTDPAANDILIDGVVTLRYNGNAGVFYLPPVVNSHVLAATSAATAAGNSATSASTSATNAANSATAAATSATTAGTHATNAGTSATNAANSATAASNSATSAGTSATNAANSATSAGTSATNAGNSATAAATSATNAANSATAAATSASSASTSASTATTKASEAETSATNAANSASSASTSATNAANSAAAAAASAASIAGGPVTSVNGMTGVVTGVATLAGAETLTNKTIAFASNTLTGVQASLVSGTNIKTINGASVLGSGDLVVGGVSSIQRSARTSNTILAAGDKGTLIEATANTYSQTITAAATLGAGWWCYVGNSGTGFITLDPNGSETITVNGAARTTWVLWPREMGLLVCDGAGFNYYCMQKGEIVQTISSTVASVSFSTGLAFRRRMSLTVENLSTSSASDWLNFQINGASADNGSVVYTNGSTVSGSSGGTINLNGNQAALQNATAADVRYHSHLLITPGVVGTNVSWSSSGKSSSGSYASAVGSAVWRSVSESGVGWITVLSTLSTLATGTFILREL